ncbi:MAG: hypothetical protein WA432_01365 [Candidatus Babeliaceae bacterium]
MLKGAIQTPRSNILIGVKNPDHTESHTIRIGTQGTGPHEQNQCYIAGIQRTSLSGHPVIVSPSGQLGMQPSSMSQKMDILPMGDYSSDLLTLPCYIFRYIPDIDPDGVLQFGFMAEDFTTSDTLTALVTDDDTGPCFIQYYEMTAMLLNEIQKLNVRLTAIGG